jgi:hypothetical protein
MWMKTSILIFCLILQSCSMSLNHFGRKPASEANFDELVNKMKNFKARVMGSEKDATCSKEQLDADFQKLLKSVQPDSCRVGSYTLNREEFNQNACPRIKTEGYFDKIVKTTIAEEKSKKPLSYFQNKVDPEFVALNKEAQDYLKSVSTVIHNHNYDPLERALLVVKYVENVLMPIRDVVVVKRSYLPKEDDGRVFYEALQLYMTPEFVKGLNDMGLALITQGPNPGSSPFYLEVRPMENGTYRLNFSEADIVKRDVLTLMKAPTAKNYVMALKWMTLHMMLSQVYLYETLVGNKADLELPKSCQTQFNDHMPSKFKFAYEEGLDDKFLEGILIGHGLTYKQDDTSYLDYYMENISRDPTKQNYSALVPFENYKNALKSVEGSGNMTSDPDFDDISHYQNVMSFKAPEAQAVYRAILKKQRVTLPGYEIFQKMLGEFSIDEIADIKINDKDTTQIYPGKQNLSPYLLEIMKSNGITDYSEVISERLKEQFAGKQVNIDFPSMYSSPVWRDWSLRTLADVVYAQKDAPAKSQVYETAQTACRIGSFQKPGLQKICQGNVLLNLADFLAEFRSGDKYVPTRRLEEAKFKDVYPLLSYLWVTFRDNLNLIPEAKPFELNFLLDQMSIGNPWARLKLSYMVALDQLESRQEGIVPQYKRTGLKLTKEKFELICSLDNISAQISNLKRAGKILGLDKPLSYDHASAFLSSKERIQVWRSIVDNIQQRNAQLFNVKAKNKTYYQLVEDISYKTILSPEAALSTGMNLSQSAINEIKRNGQKSEAQLGDFFLNLYNLKDTAKQQALFEEFSKKNGIDSAYNLKLSFLALDDSYKKPIFKDLLKQAAFTRKTQILSQLDRFCKMDINNQVEFKNIFYSTTKAQNDLNQMAGLPAVPEDVLSKINEMSPGEWRDMWWGIGSGIAGMAAVIIGGACTTVTGGICAPLGGVMAVTGLSALGIQVKLTANEYERKLQADNDEAQIKIMEDLGFSNTGSADEVHRSYAWTAFEAISIFPLMGVASRSLTLGPKLVYVSTQSMLRQTGKTAFKAVAKTAAQEEEVRSAQYLLGLSSIGKNAGVDAKTIETATTKIAKIRELYTSGEINLETMMEKISEVLAPIKRAKLAIAKSVRAEVGKVLVNESKEQIDGQAANMISNYFGDSPKAMLRLIQGYSGERLERAIKIMDEMKAVDRIGKRIPIYSKGKDWFLKMRNEALAKNAAKILKLEKDLIAMGSRPDQLEAYIAKNMDDITDIFIEIPLKKREIPYFVLVQGMPEFNFYQGRKIPLLSMFSEGQTLKKIVTARARLVYEGYKNQARNALKLKRFVKSETTYEAFKAFQLSVAEFANRKGAQEASKIMSEYRDVEEKMAKKLYMKYFMSNKEYRDYKEFKELLTNPLTLKDKATAQAIWESVPADELMGMKELGTFAHKAVEELSQYNDIDSFERYLNALKVLIINRDPAVLEIM